MEHNYNQTPPLGGAIFDVVIIGGGMVGMTMALALAREGMQVAVVERGAMSAQLAPAFDGRVSAIAQGSKRILDNLGVWADMAPHAEPITDIRVSDGDTPFFLHYDHNEVGEDPFGFIVENRHIRFALHKAASQYPNLTIFERSTLQDYKVDNDHVTVTLSEVEGSKIPRQARDDKITARLLIGAEGKQSQVRELAGIKTMQWAYGQTAIVCTIAHEKPHGGLAQERFLPAGPFAVLPMQNSRSSLVWVEPDDRAQIYTELPDDEFLQEIKERVGDYLGELKLEGGRFTYPLGLMHARHYTAKRVALIGDAAHAMHPIAGQGVNVGFRDVGVLDELLTERFKLGLDIADPGTLAHYERWRRFDNVTMLATTDLLNRLFSNKIVPIQLARGMGLWAVGKIPPLKRFFMRHAMGLVGDQSRLSYKK